MPVFFRTGWPAASVVLLCGLIGCEPVKPIRSYSIPKPEVVYEANHVDPAEPKTADGKPLPLDDRMLAALIPHGNTAWFVKLSGPKEVIAAQSEAFQAFVKSFKFSADSKAEPTWQLPANWQKTDGPPQRFATLTITDAKPAQEVTVTSLPLSDGDFSAYVLLNVNRWRAQLGLRPTVSQRMKKEMVSLKLAEGGQASYFNMLGKLQAAGMPGAPPMAGHPPIAETSPRAGGAAGAASNQADGIKFDTPVGWQAGVKDVFSQVALEAGEGADKVRVTFSALSAAAGDLTSNLNRWRGQVGLPPVETDALLANVAKMEIGGSPANYVELIGPDEAIYGAVVVHDDQAWFLKLRGTKSAADAQKDKFRELLKSIRFE